MVELSIGYDRHRRKEVRAIRRSTMRYANDGKGGTMPGRWFIGLSAEEKHPSEFQPSRLPDEPKVTAWLVIGAVVMALAMIAIGYWIDHPIPPTSCPWFTTDPEVACPEPRQWGSDIPMMVWLSLGALVTTLVVATPFLVYEFKRRTGRI